MEAVMSRAPLSLAFGLLALSLLTSLAFADQSPPTLRLDASGVTPAPNSPPCSMGMRLPPGTIQRESSRPGALIDACGRLRPDAGGAPATITGASPTPSASSNARIDSMMVYATIFDYPESYSPGGTFHLCAHAERYYLNNGSSWGSGAGSFYPTTSRFDHVETSGETLRYVMNPPIDGVLYRQTDFDSGDHSAQGEIAVEGPLVLEAINGSGTAMLRGFGRITSNDATWYGEPRFNYYNAPVGSLVPFQMLYQLTSGTFTSNTFSGTFSYYGVGSVDFVHATRPPLVSLEIKGPGRVPDQSQTPYRALAHYQSGVLADVTEQAAWSVTPSVPISGGVLSIGALATSTTYTVRAVYEENSIQVQGEREVVASHDFFLFDPGTWPMYQADSRHTGSLPVTPSPARFRLLWQQGFGAPLNPVVGGDGRVFCTAVTYFSNLSEIHALDAKTGTQLWSKNFGSVFSVNPPSYAYGNVYVQTGNHASDTWLHAFDAESGVEVFRSAHEAQWERYLAPTVHEGKVYVNGGYYGGMYAFDALTGGQLWFQPLPQYDQWTPAVGGDQVYAYVGDYQPGLYAFRRADGQPTLMIPDPNFQWNGWSMNLAPVVGTHQDVLAIHDGRLISFDVATRRIRWQLKDAYAGQPSLAAEAIYAIDGGSLVVLDEVTGSTLWSWRPPSGELSDALVVTASHAFVTSSTSVYAVDLDSRSAIWSYGVAGHLSIANGSLYVASSQGVLSAFDLGLVPPIVAHAGRDIVAECVGASGNGTPVRLDGSASEGPDLTYTWTASGVTFDDSHSITPVGRFPLGSTQVVLTVSREGNQDRDSVMVYVQDTAAPALTLEFEPGILWPPDQKLQHVHVRATATDACDPAPMVSLISVTSSEPDGGADDPFPVDILDAAIGQADFDVWLRAQRDPQGNGRAYTFCYEARDASGHVTPTCAAVVVPRSLGRAHLEPGTPSQLTIFGDSGGSVEAIDPGSIVVGTWVTDCYRVTDSHVSTDVDGDGRLDRTWDLQGLPDAGDCSGALFARWRAGGTGWSADLGGGQPTGIGDEPMAFEVIPNPNPSRGAGHIAFRLPAAGRVRLTIYDLAGRVVSRPVDGTLSQGRHEVVFDPAQQAQTSLFFYRIEWEGQRRQGRFVLVPGP
jgi:outer membrane protein assembly factor BamB